MGTEEHAAVAAGGDPQGIDTAQPDGYVVSLQDAGETQVAVAGGKGAHLGELSRIDGICVPPGFAVTTAAFRRIMEEAPSIDARLERLSRLSADDGDGIRTLSAEIRAALEGTVIPEDLEAAITRAHVVDLGDRSATARSARGQSLGRGHELRLARNRRPDSSLQRRNPV